jgi:hypothetical protein
MNRQFQADRILCLLKQHEWVDLPQIMNLRIASHTRRISDLRKRGYEITVEKVRVDGSLHTRYKLLGRADAN